MDSSPSVLDSLRTVEFRLGLKGYNVDEVDEYLEKAAVEATALKDQLRQTTERLKQATDRIAQLEAEKEQAAKEPPAPPRAEPAESATSLPVAAPPPVPVQPAPMAVGSGVDNETLSQTLLMAQRFVEQAKRESEAEASATVARAEEQAHAIVTQAEEHARRLAMDSEQRLREEVHRLESARSQLAADVESLGRYLDSERSRLRGSLDEISRWLEEKLQPGATVAALRARPVNAEITSGGPRPASSANARPAPRPSNGGGPVGGDFGAPGSGTSHSG